MPDDGTRSPSDPSSRARLADELLWSGKPGAWQYLELRDRAVVDAISAGASVEELAAVLGVRPVDVSRMSEAGAKPASNSPAR